MIGNVLALALSAAPHGAPAGSRAQVFHIAFSRTGQYMAVGGSKLGVWDLKTRRWIYFLRDPNQGTERVCSEGENHVLAWSAGRHVRVDLRSRRMQILYRSKRDVDICQDLSPQWALLWDFERVWSLNVATGKRIPLGRGAVSRLARRTGKALVGSDGLVRLVDLRTGKTIRKTTFADARGSLPVSVDESISAVGTVALLNGGRLARIGPTGRGTVYGENLSKKAGWPLEGDLRCDPTRPRAVLYLPGNVLSLDLMSGRVERSIVAGSTFTHPPAFDGLGRVAIADENGIRILKSDLGSTVHNIRFP